LIFLFLFDSVLGNSPSEFCKRTPSDFEKMERFRKEHSFSKTLDDLHAVRKQIEERRIMYQNMATLSPVGMEKHAERKKENLI